MSDHQGKCPKCGTKLVKQKMTAEQQKMMNEGTYTKPENYLPLSGNSEAEGRATAVLKTSLNFTK